MTYLGFDLKYLKGRGEGGGRGGRVRRSQRGRISATATDWGTGALLCILTSEEQHNGLSSEDSLLRE